MRDLVALAVLLLCTGAGADELRTTYVCTDAAGHRAIQDRPCAADSDSREIPTVHVQPTLAMAARQMQLEGAGNARKIQCSGRRKILQQQRDDNRLELNQIIGGMQRQNIVAGQRYLDEQCTPYGM